MRRLIGALGIALMCAACAGSGAGRATVLSSTPRAAGVTASTSLSGLGIGHVFVIVLENESYNSAYANNPNPYLGDTLQKQGTLLTQYYGIGHYSLDNYLAMISGQAPNRQTSIDCFKHTNFKPSGHHLTINKAGQAVGQGCVYPAKVKTLGDQLSADHVTWGGWMDDMGATAGREQATCGVPHLLAGKIDGTETATPQDQYAARHNPFVYFKSLVNSGLCKRHVKPLTSLPTALESVATTPAFSFITPNLCDDGHDTPCKGADVSGSNAGGLVSADHFLAKWVPIIQASPAYQKDGIIIVTSDESEISDASSCCNEKAGPTDKQPGLSGPGGGRIGTLVVGRCVTPGAQDPTPYNHYSLLRSLEDIFGVTKGGADGDGHLGYAGAAGLQPFGSDLFNDCPG